VPPDEDRARATVNVTENSVEFGRVVHMCGYYKLHISGQNLAEKGLLQAKILLRTFWGLLFYSPCIVHFSVLTPHGGEMAGAKKLCHCRLMYLFAAYD